MPSRLVIIPSLDSPVASAAQRRARRHRRRRASTAHVSTAVRSCPFCGAQRRVRRRRRTVRRRVRV